MGWKKCASCGREYARSKCPVCAFVIPTIHKRTTVQENVTATQIVKTDEEIAYATFQRGQLLYLYHKGDEYRREDGSVVLQTKHPPQLRYRICGKTTLISWRNRLICFKPDRVVNANPIVSHSLVHIIGHLLIPPVCCRSRSMSDASDLCNPIASGSIFR